MTAKHTKGPWEVHKNAPNEIWAGLGPVAMTTPRISEDIDEEQANARLIAAAPELLATLELIEDQAGRAALVQDRSVGIIKATCAIMAKDAKTAIRKARGE